MKYDVPWTQNVGSKTDSPFSTRGFFCQEGKISRGCFFRHVILLPTLYA